MEYYNNESKLNHPPFSGRVHRISPTTILILIFINTIALISSNIFAYKMFLVVSFTALLIINRKKFLNMLITYLGILLFVNLVGKDLLIGPWMGAIYTMIMMIMRIFSILVLSTCMTCYETSFIINALRKAKVPNYLAISVAIFFRFLPEYFDYINQIKEGAKVRGIQIDIRKPFKSLETYIVPLIHKAFQTGDILSSSLITKGIEYDCKKTSYRDLSLNALDSYLIAFTSILLGVTIWKM